MSNPNNSDDKGGIGCLILLVIGVFGSTIIAVVQAILQLAIVGGIGFLVWRIILYNNETGKITQFFNNLFDRANNTLSQGQQNTYLNKGSNVQMLNEPQEVYIGKLDDIANRFETMLLDNRREMEDMRSDITTILYAEVDRIDKKIDERFEGLKTDKSNAYLAVLTDAIPEHYSRSDSFEKKKKIEEQKQKEDQLTLREIKVELNEQVAQQNQKIQEVKQEAKANTDLLRDYFDKKYEFLSTHFSSLREFVLEKYLELSNSMKLEFSKVYTTIDTLKLDVKNEFADMKVWFGGEIMRLDEANMKIIGALEKQANDVRKCHVRMDGLANDIRENKIEFNNALTQAQRLYNEAQSANRKAESIIAMGLKEIGIHGQELALKTHEAHLALNEISKEKHYAVRDIAYEKMGFEWYQQEQKMRLQLQKSDVDSSVQRLQSYERRIQDNSRNEAIVTSLKNELQVEKNKQGLLKDQYHASQLRYDRAMDESRHWKSSYQFAKKG